MLKAYIPLWQRDVKVSTASDVSPEVDLTIFCRLTVRPPTLSVRLLTKAALSLATLTKSLDAYSCVVAASKF